MALGDVIISALPPIMIILGILLLIVGLIILFIDIHNVPLYGWILIGIGSLLTIIGIILLIISWYTNKPQLNLGSFGQYREI